MLYTNCKVFIHGDVISGNYFYVWASMHNSGHKCLLPDRPEFGLNIQFDPIRVIYCFIGFQANFKIEYLD